MKNIISILIFSFSIASMLHAEVKDTAYQQLKYDTNYILNYRYHIQLRTVGVNRQSAISLLNTVEDESIEFSTNNPFSFGFAVDYSWISLEYSRSIKNMEFTDSRKGKTESVAFRLRLNGRKFSGDFYLRTAHGFHLKNIEDWVPDWFAENEKYPGSNDLNTRILAGNIYYTFNHRKFSNAAVYRQTDRQIKSAGSPLIGILANMEEISSKTPMITSDSLVEKFLNISQVRYIKLGLFGGYMHTFSIYKRFFIHGSVNQGFMYSFGRGEYHNTDETRKLNALGLALSLKLALGYNGAKWFAGSLFSADYFLSDVSSELTTTTNYTYFKIYVGYRFKLWNKPFIKKLYL